MSSPDTRLRELLPQAYQKPLDPSDPNAVGYQYLALIRIPFLKHHMIMQTIQTTDLGIVLTSKGRQTAVIYLQAENAIGVGVAVGDGKVTASEHQQYLQAKADFEKDAPKMALVTSLELRAELLRREQLRTLAAQLYPGTLWDPTALLPPLASVPQALLAQFDRVTPRKLGPIVDDDRDDLSVRVKKALIIQPFNLTMSTPSYDHHNFGPQERIEREIALGWDHVVEVIEDRRAVQVKELFGEITTRHGLRVWGNYWDFGRLSQYKGAPYFHKNYSCFYQVSSPESFPDDLRRILQAGHAIRNAISLVTARQPFRSLQPG